VIYQLYSTRLINSNFLAIIKWFYCVFAEGPGHVNRRNLLNVHGTTININDFTGARDETRFVTKKNTYNHKMLDNQTPKNIADMYTVICQSSS